MPEESNANTGGGTPSPNDVGATGAGGDGATGQQTAEVSGQITPQPAAEELSAGWTFDDQPAEQSAIPDGDDDLQGMLNDPNLDQQRAPGLVEAIKSARAEARQMRVELKQFREQSAKFDQYGGFEGIEQTLGFVNGLIHTPQEGALPFWQAVAKDAQPAYWASIETLAQHAPDDVIAALERVGKLPARQAATGAGQLTADDWARIPENLRGIANQVPTNQLIEWLDKGTNESLIYNLEREAKLNQLDTTQRQQAEHAYRQASQQAEQQGRQAVEQLTEQYTKAHYAQLEKWQPFGPNDPQNQFIYKAILEGAHATLLEDPQWQKVFADAEQALERAPMRRLQNEHFAADADERGARQAAMRYNTRLGQEMKKMITSLDSVFKDARAYREQQRQSAPDRKEIPGISSTASNGHNDGASALDESGNISDGYMTRLKERMRGWRG
jgi:hypothetical protein